MADLVSPTTEAIYARLPEIHQTEDERQAVPAPDGDDPGGFPLKRFLGSLGDQAGDIEVVYDRIDAGELMDPVLADTAWLPFMAQMVGLAGIDALTEANQRAALANPAIGYRGGTVEAIIAAAKTIVGGTNHVGLYKFSTNVSAIGAATQWDVLLVTREGEALGDVVARVIELGAKPAGVKLYHREWVATWTDIHTTYPTWAEVNATPNWDAIEQTGI